MCRPILLPHLEEKLVEVSTKRILVVITKQFKGKTTKLTYSQNQTTVPTHGIKQQQRTPSTNPFHSHTEAATLVNCKAHTCRVCYCDTVTL